MDLDKAQNKIFAPVAKESQESVAISESMGMTHSFAKIAEKIETINLLILPGMTSNGLLAGELKDFYNGKSPDLKNVTEHFQKMIQSIALISAILDIPLSTIVEGAFEGLE